MKEFRLEIKRKYSSPPTVMEVLIFMTKMDSAVLKDAANKGAVWIKSNKE